MTPSRNPKGCVFCPTPSSLAPSRSAPRTTAAGTTPGLSLPTLLQDDGDVAAALADPKGTAHGPRLDPLHGRALVHVGFGHHQPVHVPDAVVLGGVGHGR